MPMSYFPDGFSYGVAIRGVPVNLAQGARVLWLGNNATFPKNNRVGSDGNAGTWDSPYATLAFALSRATAGEGDIIMVKPGHAENISTSTQVAMSSSSIAIVGLGTGNLRPTFTFTAATATINVTAPNLYLSNLLFVANFAAVASAFTLGATSNDFWLDGCEFRDTSSVLNFVNIVQTSSSANVSDGLTVTGCTINGLGTTAATTPVKVQAAIARMTIQGNLVNLAILNDTSALLALSTFAATQALIANNYVYRPNTTTANGFLISGSSTACTGIVRDNYAGHFTASGALLFATGLKFVYFNNLNIGDADASGYVLPAIGAN